MNIFWFRQDLRLEDNPGLHYAAQQEGTLCPIYILDTHHNNPHPIGAASRTWLHRSLEQLQESLHHQLLFFKGCPQDILLQLINTQPIQAIYWNRCYEPWRVHQDKIIKETLSKRKIEVKSFNASLLWEPWEILKADGTPYRVFTAYYKQSVLTPPRSPLPAPKKMMLSETTMPLACPLDALSLRPALSWDRPFYEQWQPGEHGAHQRVLQFLSNGLKQYKEGRDFPSYNAVSRLSPHLHFGEISPHQLWHAMQSEPPSIHTTHFCRELGWREFSYSLLFHNPTLPTHPLNPSFNHFPWEENTEWIERWQKGETGYPFIDAGMRELWQTGYMHNRVRMVVGSFLVKNLRQHWLHGARWFWDCLLDADLANNSASWQWVAGCGADAAPYFRVFNPVTQSTRFDPSGHYIHTFVPELRGLKPPHLFTPWTAPELLRKQAKVILDDTYPRPIVDLKTSRQQALEAYAQCKALQTNAT